MRLAVAEQETDDTLAPALGRAVKFALFDVYPHSVRGPFYRVRHDQPGEVCDDHLELTQLLHDCQVVITGGAGKRMIQRLKTHQIEVIATSERAAAACLIARHLAGNLKQARPSKAGSRHS